MNNYFILFYSPNPRSQARILIYRNWCSHVVNENQICSLLRHSPFKVDFLKNPFRGVQSGGKRLCYWSLMFRSLILEEVDLCARRLCLRLTRSTCVLVACVLRFTKSTCVLVACVLRLTKSTCVLVACVSRITKSTCVLVARVSCLTKSTCVFVTPFGAPYEVNVCACRSFL